MFAAARHRDQFDFVDFVDGIKTEEKYLRRQRRHHFNCKNARLPIFVGACECFDDYK